MARNVQTTKQASSFVSNQLSCVTSNLDAALKNSKFDCRPIIGAQRLNTQQVPPAHGMLERNQKNFRPSSVSCKCVARRVSHVQHFLIEF